MSNVYRSKEVYKRLKGVPSDMNPLRIVRGVYVSGKYRPAYYIDSCVLIEEIQSTNAVISDYISISATTTDPNSINVVGVDCNVLTMIDYSSKSDTTTENFVNVTGIDFGNLGIISYANVIRDVSDHAVNVTGIDFGNLTIQQYKIPIYETNEDHMIQVEQISSTSADITDKT